MQRTDFVLDPGPAGATRLARALAVSLLALARRLDEPLDDAAVHALRRELKRARAQARLVRPALGGRRFRAINVALRDAGRELAGRRDARVLVDTLQRLVAEAELAGDGLATLAAQLDSEWQAASVGDDARPAAKIAASAAARIRAAAAVLRGARVGGDWPVLADGLRSIYRRGRRAMAAAAREPSAECLHEWRKQVKHLWHSLEVLEPAWPKPMRALAREAHRLSDRLGDDHDLAALRERVAGAVLAAEERRGALEAIDVRRLERQRSAFRLGERLYAEAPARLVARVGAWYRAGSDGGGAPPATGERSA